MTTTLPAVWQQAPPIGTGSSDYQPQSRAEQVAQDFLFSYRNTETRKNYTAGLKRWFGFCAKAGMDPLAAQRTHVERFLVWVEEVEGKSRRTAYQAFTAMRGFYRRAMIDGAIEKDPCYLVKAPAVPRKTSTNDLSRVELVRILKKAKERSERDYAVFCLLGYNGLRVGELVAIDIEHFGRDRGFYVVTVTRKGGDTQTLALSQETAWAVERCIGTRTTGPLLVSTRTEGRRLHRNDIQQMVKRYARWCGITQRISPHSFRHTFITQSLNAGASARDVQMAAGHKDGRMTSYYDHGNQNRGREATHALTAYIAEML